MTQVHIFAQYPIHASVEKWWGKDKALTHSYTHMKEDEHTSWQSPILFLIPNKPDSIITLDTLKSDKELSEKINKNFVFL